MNILRKVKKIKLAERLLWLFLVLGLVGLLSWQWFVNSGRGSLLSINMIWQGGEEGAGQKVAPSPTRIGFPSGSSGHVKQLTVNACKQLCQREINATTLPEDSWFERNRKLSGCKRDCSNFYVWVDEWGNYRVGN